MTFCPPRTPSSACSSASRGHDVESEQQVLDRDELVSELPHLVERRVEHAAERVPTPAAAPPPETVGSWRESRLGFGAKGRGAVAGTIDERARQLLVEERQRAGGRG